MPAGLDVAHANESEQVAQLVHDTDPFGFAARWSKGVRAQVDKYDLDALAAAARYHELAFREPTGRELEAWARHAGYLPETVESDGNLLTTAGLNRITSLIIAGGGQAWDATHTRIGVGDDATAAAIGNTDLTAAAGSTHRQFVVADSTYPQQSNGVITVKATHGTSLSNFHWQEWGIDNGTANGTTVVAVLMNHKVTDLGTKTSAASWVFTCTVTLA